MPAAALFGDDVATSLELRFLVDRSLFMHERGQAELSQMFARAAEAVVASAFGDCATLISSISSRKGNGDAIAEKLGKLLSPGAAAAVVVVWMLRGARGRGIRAVSGRFQNHEQFKYVVRLLCRRLFVAVK